MIVKVLPSWERFISRGGGPVKSWKGSNDIAAVGDVRFILMVRFISWGSR